MRYVILGTAGHIDHGKSSIVEAMTGINPDRLKEEKERGITIDLGFADLKYPDGLTIGVVDVPGHEKLVRNMLAGAGGIDMVLLVIAADEGVMPQSREHLHICNLLKIKSGIIAITKSDLVEPDWMELVTAEVREFVKGSFLENAEIVPVSSKTGHNLEILKTKIHDLALKTEPKPAKGLFRLPVDRVFTLKGFGTVVTGTAVSGEANVDEQVEILPSGIVTKIRGLHSHGHPVTRIRAGQRAALNLQGMEKEDLKRGDTIVNAGRFSTTTAIDASLEILGDAIEVKSKSMVHFHLGTAETVARVVLYGRDKIGPGEKCYCQFRLVDPVVAQSGDRYIIRRFSPLETIGGGSVLDPLPHRRRMKEGTDDLAVYEAGSLSDKIATKVRKSALAGMSKNSLEGWIKAELPAIRDAAAALSAKKTIVRFDDMLFHEDAFVMFKGNLVDMLKDFHAKNPLRPGIAKEEVRARLNMEQRVFGNLLVSIDDVVVDKDILRLKSFAAAASDEDKKRILELLDQSGVQPPSKDEISEKLGLKGKQLSDVLNLMHKDGLLVRINESMHVTKKTFDHIMSVLKTHFAKKPDLTVAEFRDLLGTSRKFALPFLEYLDSTGVTLRVGDVRKLLHK